MCAGSSAAFKLKALPSDDVYKLLQVRDRPLPLPLKPCGQFCLVLALQALELRSMEDMCSLRSEHQKRVQHMRGLLERW